MNDEEKYREAVRLLTQLSPGDQLALEKAVTLVTSTVISLKRGVKHYNKAGELLETPEKILETLRDEGEIKLDTSEVK